MTAARLGWLVGTCSRIGLTRTQNMDAVFVRPRDGVFVLADGIGSTPRGGDAARLAVEVFVRELPSATDDAAPDEAAVRRAVDAVQTAVLAEFCAGPLLTGGTTLCAALVTADRLLVVNLGDSRCYLLREGELRRLTSDHTVAAHLVAIGAAEEGSPLVRRTAHHLRRYLGSAQPVDPDVSTCPARSGDVVLLSTDGLHDVLDNERMRQILTDERHPAAAAVALVDAAQQAGGTDDATAIVVHAP